MTAPAGGAPMNLETILSGQKADRADEIRLVLGMSIPAILAQLTSIAMQYTDAAMVGRIGPGATAAIGLVSSSTWLVGGSLIGISAGFYVQIAQLIGSGRNKDASDVFRQGLTVCLLAGLLIGAAGALISGSLPRWLGGEADVLSASSAYFFIYSLSVPFAMLRQLSAGTMQSTGDMKTPSILASLVCLTNVVFNFLLIFPVRTVHLPGSSVAVPLPGAGLGVVGAALGTALAEVVISLVTLYFASFRNKKISLFTAGSWRFKEHTLRNAAGIGIPMSCDQIFMCSAYVAGTMIVARLGTVAVAANSLAITAESLCYMPGYGIGAAATAIIGQTIGARRPDLTKSFSRVSVCLGMVMMGLTGLLMFIGAPFVFSVLTSSAEVAALGTSVLRTELFAEPLYAASICCAGVFRGAGDTLRPSLMNLLSMWGVRIVLAFFLVPRMGLHGYWTAMAIELCFRGTIFLIRLCRGKWMKDALV